MFENTPALELTVGRSSVRQRILALLMDESTGRLHLREIQRRALTSPGTASRELARLVAAGLVEREAEGNQVYFRVSGSPLAAMLRTVLAAMPAQQVGPRPSGVRQTTSGPSSAAPTETLPSDAATIPPPIPAQPPASTGAAAGEEALVEAEPAVANVQASPPPRVVRPLPARPVTKADPLGLRIAGRLAASIREIYGDSLRGIYLYGPRAGGPAPADTDVETIIVLERVDHYGAELERTSQVCAALSHEMNVVVSRIFVSEAAWNSGPDGPAPPIRAEAIAL